MGEEPLFSPSVDNIDLQHQNLYLLNIEGRGELFTNYVGE